MKVMQWVPFTNSHDGDGFTQLMSRKNGTAIFGAWVLIVQVASKCNPRGTLLRSNGKPHDFETLARMTRGESKIFEESIKTLKEIGWIEEFDQISQPAGGCGESAGSPHPTDEEGRKEGTEGTERNGMEEEEWNIFKVWVECLNTPSHKTFSGSMKKAIDFQLESYPEEDLVEAIKLYDQVLGSNSHWYSYKHTFEEFFRKGAQKPSPFTKFLPEMNPLQNFLTKEPQNGPNRQYRSFAQQQDDEHLKILHSLQKSAESRG